ncbi:conserved hypothetical protein [Streptomyces viridochromogenes DSM 40736]|uniref:Uncharacterized protein n=1 Tax=Streptomyces viridochromogenes (strain DSM 40736 / JCM 4977 / BCRC 1201 / Tue 494) TaxID=591159 RepID=D9X547_STRVT|nr:hypothetical protein [Streptomyces viridochromogenes]EFL31785.1 conserved hypothetical protein [Streptomyces viridochromogenes DSM 40736]
MSDMTRQPGDPSVAGDPTAPDARGETALGTGHGTTAPRTDRGVDTDRTGRHGTDVHATDLHGTEAPRGDSYGTGPEGATGAGTGTHAGDLTGTHKTGASGSHLLAHDESDKLGSQLQHAVAGFVDGPRAAVEEADHVLEEIAARFTEAVTKRRRTLRHSWQSVESGEGKPVSSADTEQLRLALKDYRELAERLLHV